MITKEQLKRARMMAFLSQYEAAELVGVHGVTFSSWESGNRPINQAAAQLFILKTEGLHLLALTAGNLPDGSDEKHNIRKVLEMMK